MDFVRLFILGVLGLNLSKHDPNKMPTGVSRYNSPILGNFADALEVEHVHLYLLKHPKCDAGFEFAVVAILPGII